MRALVPCPAGGKTFSTLSLGFPTCKMRGDLGSLGAVTWLSSLPSLTCGHEPPAATATPGLAVPEGHRDSALLSHSFGPRQPSGCKYGASRTGGKPQFFSPAGNWCQEFWERVCPLSIF